VPRILRWGVNALEGGGDVNTVKTLKLKKVRVHDPPPAPMVAPPLLETTLTAALADLPLLSS